MPELSGISFGETVSQTGKTDIIGTAVLTAVGSGYPTYTQNKEKQMNPKRLTKIAAVAAIYTVISLVLAPFSYGPIQVRIAEALTLLPLIWKPGIIALTLGCFLTNFIGVAMHATGPIDIVVGTLATFLAAVCTYKLKDRKVKGIPVLAILMPVLFNGVFVGLELAWILNPGQMWPMALIYGLQVAAGELISVIIGWFIIRQLDKTELFKE